MAQSGELPKGGAGLPSRRPRRRCATSGWMVRYGRRKIRRSFFHTRYFVLHNNLLANCKKKPNNNMVPREMARTCELGRTCGEVPRPPAGAMARSGELPKGGAGPATAAAAVRHERDHLLNLVQISAAPVCSRISSLVIWILGEL